ncbi:hypothetical protein Tco_0488309 [Tanacetum coccineum]
MMSPRTRDTLTTPSRFSSTIRALERPVQSGRCFAHRQASKLLQFEIHKACLDYKSQICLMERRLLGFRVYQNGMEECLSLWARLMKESICVYIHQGSKIPKFLRKSTKWVIALYGLHHAPRGMVPKGQTLKLAFGILENLHSLGILTTDSDSAGASILTGINNRRVSIFGRRLITWQCKSNHCRLLLQQKQNMLLCKVYEMLRSRSVGSRMTAQRLVDNEAVVAQPCAGGRDYLEAHQHTLLNPTSEAPMSYFTDSSSAQFCEVPFEQQPDLSPSLHPVLLPNPSPTPNIPDSIPEHTGENLGDHSFNDTSLSGNEDAMTLQNVYDLCISLCKQVSDQAKEIKLLKAKITKLKKENSRTLESDEELDRKGRRKWDAKKLKHLRQNSSEKLKSRDTKRRSQGMRNKDEENEEKEVDYEVLDRKYPIIDWKTVCLGTKPQFDESKEGEINLNVVTRSNGQQRYFSVLTIVLSIFDREDLNAVSLLGNG